MTNTEPELKMPEAIPIQLCFFYDTVTHKIPFSSSSLVSFFAAPIDLQDDPPFLAGIEGQDTDFLSREWESCLQLKAGETQNFTITTTKTESPLSFYFTVMKPAPSVLTDSSLLTISVTRMMANYPSRADTKVSLSLIDQFAEFIELAAHDLDSPLRKLSMLLERISSKYDNKTEKDTQSYFLRARASIADMRSLIENLALLGRLNNTSKKIVSCNLESIIQAVVKDMEGLPEEKKINIRPGSLPVVEGDISQYRQLFRSLLENAFKFSKKEISSEVEIFWGVATEKEKQLHRLHTGNIYFKITISDNGIGFRQEQAEKIFQPLVRLNGKSEFPGSGIGLALSKKIVENHGGIIHAESEENIGARFILFLPLSPY